MRTRTTGVLGALAASAALMTGLAASAAPAAAATPAHAGKPAAQAAACQQQHVMAYVTTATRRGAVTPLDTVTGATLKPIPVGSNPLAIVATPKGRMAYVANQESTTVTVIRASTGTVVKTIPVHGPQGMTTVIGVTPNGKTVYVSFGTTVVPILTSDNKALKPISTRVAVTGMVFTPDSRKLYVNSWNGKVVPVNTVTNTMGKPIVLPSYEVGLAITPDGRTLWAASGYTLTPISTATNKAGQPIRFAGQITDVVISKGGRTGYVSNLGSYGGPGELFPVNLVTATTLAPVNLPGVASSMVLAPDGKTLYVMEQLAATVTAIGTATRTVLTNVKVRSMPGGIVITPDGRTVYVLNGARSLTPIRTATNKAGAVIPLSGYPSGIAFVRC